VLHFYIATSAAAHLHAQLITGLDHNASLFMFSVMSRFQIIFLSLSNYDVSDDDVMQGICHCGALLLRNLVKFSVFFGSYNLIFAPMGVKFDTEELPCQI